MEENTFFIFNMRFFIRLFLLGLAFTWPSSAFSSAKYALSIESVPLSIPADGKSSSQILVNVTLPSGSPVPEGTEVRFTTTSGAITSASYTAGGRALAILTASNSPETATVTATCYGVSASIQVDFIADRTGDENISRVVRIRGENIAYSIERNLVFASSGVEIDCSNFKIKASNAQFCETLGILKAQGNVCIETLDAKIYADAVRFDLRTNSVRIARKSEEDDGKLAVYSISPDGREIKIYNQNSVDFCPIEDKGTKIWIQAKKLSIFPGEKILANHATLCMGDTPVLSFHNYVITPENRLAFARQFRYNDYQGLVIDLPVFYNVSEKSTGAVKLRFAHKGSDYGSYFSPRKGASIALEQDFSLGKNNESRLFVDAVTSDERSIEIISKQTFTRNSRLEFQTRYQPKSKWAKNAITTNMNVFGESGNFDYYLNGYFGGSQTPVWNPSQAEFVAFESQTYGSIKLSVRQKKPIETGFGFKAFLNLSIGYGGMNRNKQHSFDPSLYQSAGFRLAGKQIDIGKTTLSFDGIIEATIAEGGETGGLMRAGTAIRRNWRNGSGSLHCFVNLQSGPSPNFYSSSKFNLNGNLMLGNGKKWNGYAFLGWGIDTGNLNLYASGFYKLNDAIVARANYSFYRHQFYAGKRTIVSEFSHLKIGLYHPVAPYEIGLAWSPDGKQFAYRGSKKIWLEIRNQGL